MLNTHTYDYMATIIWRLYDHLYPAFPLQSTPKAAQFKYSPLLPKASWVRWFPHRLKNLQEQIRLDHAVERQQARGQMGLLGEGVLSCRKSCPPFSFTLGILSFCLHRLAAFPQRHRAALQGRGGGPHADWRNSQKRGLWPLV